MSLIPFLSSSTYCLKVTGMLTENKYIIHFLMKLEGVTPKWFLNWRVKCCG